MRKWFTRAMAFLMLAMGLFGAVCIPVLADDTYTGVYDNAGLLTEEEKEKLSTEIATLERQKGYHILLVITEDLQGKDAAAYADDFFEEYNGDGTSGAGILLLMDIENGDIIISTSGESVIETFTDTRIDELLDGVYNEAVSGDFYGGCQSFLDNISGIAAPAQEATVGRVFDSAGLMTSDEILKLEKSIEKLENNTGLRVLITTTEDAQGMTSQDYAAHFFESHNDGGRKSEGIMYLINMEEREIYVYTAGDKTTSAFTDKRVDKMLDRIYNKVSDDNYYKSCDVFLDNVSKYAPSGKKGPGVIEILIELVICVLLGRIIVFFMTRNQGGKVVAGVNNYFVASATQELVHQDQFVNRMVTRRRIVRDDDDGPGGDGGSSVHRSASGTFHGGGSRSFGGGSSGGGGRKF